mgnify:CR=1 FL=1
MVLKHIMYIKKLYMTLFSGTIGELDGNTLAHVSRVEELGRRDESVTQKRNHTSKDME